MTTQRDLRPRLKQFALRIINMYASLPKDNVIAQVLGKQVLRSGTSIGANYCEAFRARSSAEFVSKTGDALKEAEETAYWLELLVDAEIVKAQKMDELLSETQQIIAIIVTINKKVKADLNSSKQPSS